MTPDINTIFKDDELRKIVGLTIDEFDDELKRLGNAAIKKLILSGVSSSKIKAKDSYIEQTISAYIRGNYRYTDKDIAQENRLIFEENKNFMSSLSEYTTDSADTVEEETEVETNG